LLALAHIVTRVGERAGEESAMRLERLDGEETHRQVGAAVVRVSGGDVVLELGPADGPPLARLHMTHSEAVQLASTLQSVAHGGGESILIVED
jgi:hypothetical protein